MLRDWALVADWFSTYKMSAQKDPKYFLVFLILKIHNTTANVLFLC